LKVSASKSATSPSGKTFQISIKQPQLKQLTLIVKLNKEYKKRPFLNNYFHVFIERSRL
jgi:hypothetical protein